MRRFFFILLLVGAYLLFQYYPRMTTTITTPEGPKSRYFLDDFKNAETVRYHWLATLQLAVFLNR